MNTLKITCNQIKYCARLACYKFNYEVQGNTTFDQFVKKLKLLSKDCFYTNADIIRNSLVFGITTP